MKVTEAPERFRNPIARHIILRDPDLCTKCGTCMRTCPNEVFSVTGKLALRPPRLALPGTLRFGEVRLRRGLPCWGY